MQKCTQVFFKILFSIIENVNKQNSNFRIEFIFQILWGFFFSEKCIYKFCKK